MLGNAPEHNPITSLVVSSKALSSNREEGGFLLLLSFGLSLNEVPELNSISCWVEGVALLPESMSVNCLMAENGDFILDLSRIQRNLKIHVCT